ncbi:TetR/AcrR family transcriptional regulator [Saccharopolyspora griseoalba]|uniref:TetR/AcrR family transcriptional regulator n=1 Tax=Saccharopolyspora griseoalba TaxID=1431848 RepID=A0ABW2LF70_9PSEU
MSSTKKARKRPGSGAGSARRAELLEIAAQLFATRGYAQTTVRDIADEAGILSGSLYHHFSSKETMLEEILRSFMDGLLERFQEIVAGAAAPREALDGLVRYSFTAIHEQQAAVSLYQNEIALLSRLPDFGFVEESSRRVESIWIAVLEEGRRTGDFREDLEPSLVYRFLRDAVWSSVRWYNPEGTMRHDALAEQCLLLLHTGLLAD